MILLSVFIIQRKCTSERSFRAPLTIMMMRKPVHITLFSFYDANNSKQVKATYHIIPLRKNSDFSAFQD